MRLWLLARRRRFIVEATGARQQQLQVSPHAIRAKHHAPYREVAQLVLSPRQRLTNHATEEARVPNDGHARLWPLQQLASERVNALLKRAQRCMLAQAFFIEVVQLLERQRARKHGSCVLRTSQW